MIDMSNHALNAVDSLNASTSFLQEQWDADREKLAAERRQPAA
jgi:hypothetical protein